MSSDPKEIIDVTKLPLTPNAFKWTFTSTILYLILHVLTFMMPAVMVMTFYSAAQKGALIHWRIIFIFVDVMAWWGTYLILSLFYGKLFLIILNLIHKPKEGLFKIDPKDPDYRFFCLRISVKKFIFWIWNNWCFPWASNLAFKTCDIRADFKSTMFDGWSDVEFIEYGNNIMLGQGAVVQSSMILRIDSVDYLLIQKVTIGDHVVIGGNAIVAPGSVIGANTTLGVWASTHIGQILEPGWIYIGRPARKYKNAEKMLEDSKKEIVSRNVDTGERTSLVVKRYTRKDLVDIAVEDLDKLYLKWKDIDIKLKRKKLRQKRKKEEKEIIKS